MTPVVRSTLVMPLLWLMLSACPSPQCDAASCPSGCCDAQGQCQAGTEATSCGTAGAQCTSCGAQVSCVEHTCRAVPPVVDGGRDAGLDAGVVTDAGVDAGDVDAGPFDAGLPWVSDAGCSVIALPRQMREGGYRVDARDEWTFARISDSFVTQRLDYLQVDLVWSSGGVSPVTSDLAQEPDFAHCRYCVRYSRDCFTDATLCGEDFLARAGTVRITQAARGQVTRLADGGVVVQNPPTNSLFSFSLTGTRFYRWDMVNDRIADPTRCIEFFDTSYDVLVR